ncbi:uncharacterized protein HMPREF1541_04696 [Cyphellophora europaea CBS 101466]|uniref:SCP domain-containing protein n=1 Tax=Cyphellophora europaea (strain CBS 101466) TaxID=1220924 RepID=W2RXN0_CYPE1|nr:uncharacterized protein HMPREF1541_04696 [Cyphellophora europaea CBS 101466]ETN40419.1 hypothetical protein HMPREF1541_04696 [Cyphellophora europaea CBS 101466]
MLSFLLFTLAVLWGHSIGFTIPRADLTSDSPVLNDEALHTPTPAAFSESDLLQLNEHLMSIEGQTGAIRVRTGFQFEAHITAALSLHRGIAGVQGWELVWDDNLARIAQEAADQCDMSHPNENAVVGTSFVVSHIGYGAAFDLEKETKAALETWRNEGYRSDGPRTYTTDRPSIMTQGAKTVGCAWSRHCAAYFFKCAISTNVAPSMLKKSTGAVQDLSWASENMPKLINQFRAARGVKPPLAREPAREWEAYNSANKCKPDFVKDEMRDIGFNASTTAEEKRSRESWEIWSRDETNFDSKDGMYDLLTLARGDYRFVGCAWSDRCAKIAWSEGEWLVCRFSVKQ